MVLILRLFIAVEIENPDVLKKIIALRDELLSCSKGSRGIKGVEDENIHLTIRFLGEVPESLVPMIRNCLNECKNISKFEIEIRGVGAFPSVSRPRVIWVGISKGIEELKTLRRMIDRCLGAMVRPDDKEFVPHITIGRIKGSCDRACLASFINSHSDELLGTSPVTKVKLKRSILRPQGPEYIDIYEVELK